MAELGEGVGAMPPKKSEWGAKVNAGRGQNVCQIASEHPERDKIFKIF